MLNSPEKSDTAKHGSGWLDRNRATALLATVLIWLAVQLEKLWLAFSLRQKADLGLEDMAGWENSAAT